MDPPAPPPARPRAAPTGPGTRVSSRTRLISHSNSQHLPSSSHPSSPTQPPPYNQSSGHTSPHILKERAPSQSRMLSNPFGAGWTHTERRRAGVFIMAVIVGLASGSNYVYSAYAPQLANQLVISATLVNLIGLAGNFGVYLSGPAWGVIVDSRGPRIPLLAGGLCCLVGYSVVHAFFTHAIPLRINPTDEPSHFRLSILLFAMFLTGCGGSAGLASGVNAVAKSFPDATRASATGTVLAGFGLSAFLFSALGQWLWAGDTGGLLALLAIGTGGPMLIGAWGVQPVPPEEAHPGVGYDPLAEDDADDELPRQRGVEVHVEAAEAYGSPALSRASSVELSRSMELTRSRSPMTRGRHPHPQHEEHHAHFPDDLPSHSEIHQHSIVKPGGSHIRSQSLSSIPPTLLTHTPLDLLRAPDFWLLFTILAILCGTGLMYINNAGTVALALAREGKRVFDKPAVSRWQAKQVGLVSIWNCAGRVLGGIYSDFCKTRYQIARIWFLPVVATLFIISQFAALETVRVQSLWMVSSLLGLAYGALFNVMPMLVLEWFGMRHFSQNWGWTAVAPIIGSNAFNMLFGRVYDAHTLGRIGPNEPEDDILDIAKLFKRGGSSLPDDGKHDCLVGEECYGTAFKVSLLACVLALALSVIAGLRRERKSRERRKAM
ncbi:hypothetical protein IAT38_005924 [Cryptococcus sp. DSM 104549]